MRKGDLWNVEIPATNGHEQSGIRPAIVLSEGEAGVAMIVPLTSKLQSLKYRYTVEVIASNQNGLKATSVALVFQLRAIDSKRLKEKIGVLDAKTMEEIEKQAKLLLKF